MLRKMIGCILMIVGVAVGAGMLALPLATAQANFQTTLLMMLFSWTIMTIGALAILEVNLSLPEGSNFISMANQTLGKKVGKLTWLVYLLLLYSLLCAYLSGTGDILKGLLSSIHITIPRWSATLLALIILGAIVIKDVMMVDVVNRGLMTVKLLAYLILVFAIAPHISFPRLCEGNYVYQTSTLMVIMTSFGFAPIVPTLRTYLKSDAKKLASVILWGSIFAFLIYFLWTVSIQGLISRTGEAGLMAMSASQEPNSLLMQAVSALVQSEILNVCAKVFISICAVTSFLGVSLALTDFIADGLRVEKRRLDGIKVYALTFVPPLIVVLLAPGIFIKALSYAGFCCVFLLILLPVMMLYSARYRKSLAGANIVPGGKIALMLVGIISVILLGLQFV